MKKKKKAKPDKTSGHMSNIEKFTETLELPKDALFNLPKFEMIGNREMLIENYKGVLEYSDCVIKINASRFVVSITGRDLEIKSMTQDSIYLIGFINGVEFL